MAKDDDKKRRGGGGYSSLIKFGLPAAVVLYVVFGHNQLAARGGAAALLPAGFSGGLRQAAEKQVPVPKTPRSVIRYYDGNTVVT
jgi:hypothetical protein